MVAPTLQGIVPPQASGPDDEQLPVWPLTALAAAAGALEADDLRQLAPVDRVEPTLAGADRHGDSMSHLGGEQKEKTCEGQHGPSRDSNMSQFVEPIIGCGQIIPTLTDIHPWAHWRSPMDMMRQG